MRQARDACFKFWTLSESTKKTSGFFSAPKSQIWLKLTRGPCIHLGTPKLSTDLGSEACTLFRLCPDVRYTYETVGVKMHAYCTISKHRYELAARFSR